MTNTNTGLPTIDGADFNFWDDVIGDDLVVDGVVYSHSEWQYDGEGGVEHRPYEAGQNSANLERACEQLGNLNDEVYLTGMAVLDGTAVATFVDTITYTPPAE